MKSRFDAFRGLPALTAAVRFNDLVDQFGRAHRHALR
jgi:hypothetical protein